MSDYEAAYEDLFVRNLRRYASIRKAIKRRTIKVLEDPYTGTEAIIDMKLGLAMEEADTGEYVSEKTTLSKLTT